MTEPAEDRVLGIDSEGRVFDVGPYGSISTIAGVLAEDYPNCEFVRTRVADKAGDKNFMGLGYLQDMYWYLYWDSKSEGSWRKTAKGSLPKGIQVYLIIGD